MKIIDLNRRQRSHRRIPIAQIRDWEIGVKYKEGKRFLEHLLRTEKNLTLLSLFPMIYSSSQFYFLPLPSPLFILLLLLQQGICGILLLLTAWQYLGNRAHYFQSFLLLSQPSGQWCSTSPHRPLDGRSRVLGRWWWAAVGLWDTSWIMLPISWVR